MPVWTPVRSFQVIQLVVAVAQAVLVLSGEEARGQFVSRERHLAIGELKIGMSAPQTGRDSYLGVATKEGCLAYFARANSEGGVLGRRLILIDYDDRCEPLETVSNVERLINRDQVFALMNFVGTPTCASVMSLVNDANIVLLGPVTGAAIFREPMQKLIFNTRASYEEEVEALVEHLTTDLGISRLALFRPNDYFGAANRDVVLNVLNSRSLQLVAEGEYARDSSNLQEAANEIAKAKPEAVIMFGTYKPCADFVLRAKQGGLEKVVFCSVSSVGTAPLIKFLGAEGDGVIISQVVPSPFDDSIPLVREYQKDIRAAGVGNFDYASLEGYLNAVVLVKALRAADPALTGETFLRALERTNLELGSFLIRFDDGNRKGSHEVFLTKIERGHTVPIQKLTSSDSRR